MGASVFHVYHFTSPLSGFTIDTVSEEIYERYRGSGSVTVTQVAILATFGLLGLPSLAGRAALAQTATPSIRSRPRAVDGGASCTRATSGLKKL